MMDELMPKLVALVLTRVDRVSKQLGEAISRCSSGRGPTAVPWTSRHVLVQLREAISRCSSEGLHQHVSRHGVCWLMANKLPCGGNLVVG
jgi:hypothetical protein